MCLMGMRVFPPWTKNGGTISSESKGATESTSIETQLAETEQASYASANNDLKGTKDTCSYPGAENRSKVMAVNDISEGVDIYDDLQREYARLCDLTEVEVEKLRFESHDEGVEWYIKYGKALGFSVRKDDVKRDKYDVITERNMVCNAQGERRPSAHKDTLRHYPVRHMISKSNHCHRDDIEKLFEGDAVTTLAYLKSKTNGDMDFFMEYTVEEDRMLENVFWVDSSSIADFIAFGEVLMFDITYKKNKYNLPFVIFSGVNHHYSTCIFGCALLQHEKEDNYTWALDTLTKAMGGKKPTVVITDGDHAMSIAITKVFPKATHQDEDEEFTVKWNEFVEKCSLTTNNWVKKHLFDKRHEWAHTYFRGIFFAGMKTTSRCEGLNSKLGKYVGHNYSLLEFCVNFDRWMEDMREEERRLDYESIHRAPKLTSKTMRSVEKSAFDVYTLKAFDKFKLELEKSSIWSKESEETIGDYHIYILKKYDPNNSTREKVTYDVEKKSAECTCKAFSILGIPCKHMIAILKEEAIFEIPDSFVIRRFTKKPKIQKRSRVQSNYTDGAYQNRLRHGNLLSSTREFLKLGASSAEAYKVAQTGIDEVNDKLRTIEHTPTSASTVKVPEELQ
ncbi:Protein FAR1-RELATED SEQUENCE 5, partial [Linum perenne]